VLYVFASRLGMCAGRNNLSHEESQSTQLYFRSNKRCWLEAEGDPGWAH
jgi:hypothetical protein